MQTTALRLSKVILEIIYSGLGQQNNDTDRIKH